MATFVTERSRITAKGQTTVPKAVRQALGVGHGDEIAFVVDEQGVRLRRAEAGETDPVIDSFLRFLAGDMERNPSNIAPFPRSLIERMAMLTEGLEVDLNDDIEGPVAL